MSRMKSDGAGAAAITAGSLGGMGSGVWAGNGQTRQVQKNRVTQEQPVMQPLSNQWVEQPILPMAKTKAATPTIRSHGEPLTASKRPKPRTNPIPSHAAHA